MRLPTAPLALSILAASSLAFAGVNIKYEYDAAGRLVSAIYDGGTEIEYVYDANGNLRSRKITELGNDSDGDLIDDTWERDNFGNLDRDGTGDADGDGQSDAAEYLAGTDPNDRKSALRVTRNPKVQGGTVTITWASVPGKSYKLQFKNALDDANWQELPSTVTADATTATAQDATAAGLRNRYYRVRVLDGR